MNKNFNKYLNSFIKKEGFKKSKKNRTWYKYCIEHDTYFILNIEKSRFDDSFYIYLGFNYSTLPSKDEWNNKILDIYTCNVSCTLQVFDTKEDLEILKRLSLDGIPNNIDNGTCKKIFDFILFVFKSNKTKYDFIKNYNHKGCELEDYAKWMEEINEK